MKKRPAFTLIEMIIVIAIIAVMAAMAITSFGTARQQATLDLATDLLVSTFKRQQQLATSGKTFPANSSQEQESSLMCYGISLHPSSTESDNAVQLLEAPYKALDSTLGQADFCDFNQITTTPFPQFGRFVIRDVTLDDRNVTESLSIFFKPPFSKPIIQLSERTQSAETPVLLLGVASPNGTEEKKVRFDSATGLIERL